MEKKIWTREEEILLEKLYSEGRSINEISMELHKTPASIYTKASKLGLSKKYIRNNNANFKAIYQDYNWCYDRFINKGIMIKDMAKECGATVRVVAKWCSEKHGLNENTFRANKKLNKKQKELIMFGILGDGHIDKRDKQPMYIESHAEDEKEYMFWKYSILKDVCRNEPARYDGKVKIFNNNEYTCKPCYRLNTRIIDDLYEIREMSNIEIFKKLNEFGLSTFMLDDGHRSMSNWELCVAAYTKEEINYLIEILNNTFGLIAKIKECDNRYIVFTADSSRKIDSIILKHVPNDIDIVKKKITEKYITNKAKYIYVVLGEKKVGLSTYCKSNKLPYERYKQAISHTNKEEFSVCELDAMVKEFENKEEGLK